MAWKVVGRGVLLNVLHRYGKIFIIHSPLPKSRRVHQVGRRFNGGNGGEWRLAVYW